MSKKVAPINVKKNSSNENIPQTYLEKRGSLSSNLQQSENTDITEIIDIQNTVDKNANEFKKNIPVLTDKTRQLVNLNSSLIGSTSNGKKKEKKGASRFESFPSKVQEPDSFDFGLEQQLSIHQTMLRIEVDKLLEWSKQPDLIRKDFSEFDTAALYNSYVFHDLSGINDLTDFGVYKLCQKVKMDPNAENAQLDQTVLNACRSISVWSLAYLNKASENISDFNAFNLSMKHDTEIPVNFISIMIVSIYLNEIRR